MCRPSGFTARPLGVCLTAGAGSEGAEMSRAGHDMQGNALKLQTEDSERLSADGNPRREKFLKTRSET